jgi:hypothetical protein
MTPLAVLSAAILSLALLVALHSGSVLMVLAVGAGALGAIMLWGPAERR